MSKARTFFIASLLIVFCISLASPGWSARRGKPSIPAGQRVEKKAETIIFPVDPQKRKPSSSEDTVLSGIFSGRGSEPGGADRSPEINSAQDPVLVRKQPTRKKTENTIAWIARDGMTFHDPFLDCANIASGSEKIWINNVVDLCGLDPCEECFIKTNHAPEFIIKESRGLDLASAASILDNKGFVAWLAEHLPVKNPGFLSTRRLLIYPALEMTEVGLQQLARETELAYRRHTWKVIEVIGKKSELDTENLSSFADEASAP